MTTVAGAAWLVRAMEAYAGPIADPELAEVDAIALLGGRTKRVHHAAALHRRSGRPILVTGRGTGDSGFAAESQKMQDILRKQHAIEPRWLETAARDTEQNAVFTACLVRGEGVRHVALVTDPLHMPRAVLAFRLAGFSVTPAPALDAPSRAPAVAGRESWWPSAAGVRAAQVPLRELGGMVLLLRNRLRSAVPPCPAAPSSLPPPRHSRPPVTPAEAGVHGFPLSRRRPPSFRHSRKGRSPRLPLTSLFRAADGHEAPQGHAAAWAAWAARSSDGCRIPSFGL